MCTAVNADGRFFARNLDLERGYGEGVTVTPRQYPFRFSDGQACEEHDALIGVAAVMDRVPLYFDGMNERGLCAAGLNFPEAVYLPPGGGAGELAPFEVIPRVLTACGSVAEAVAMLSRCRVVDITFSEAVPSSPLHWLIADRERAVAVEPTAEGLRIYEDSEQVLTNSPAFPMQMANLRQYRRLSPADEEGVLLSEAPYSKGTGAFGLPGDLSSMSRFVRAVFTRRGARFSGTAEQRLGQVFHLLTAVEQVRGCNRTPDGDEETRYTGCMDRDTGRYYYTTYENRQITVVDRERVPLDGTALSWYPLRQEQWLFWQN